MNLDCLFVAWRILEYQWVALSAVVSRLPVISGEDGGTTGSVSY